MRTDIGGKPIKNFLLQAIPEEEYKTLRPFLQAVDVPRHLILDEAGEKIEHGYFLDEGMTSLVVLTRDGRSVEVGVVGREGMVGVPVVMGIRQSPFRCIMQIGGAGHRINSKRLEEVQQATPELHQKLSHYVVVNGLQVGQIAACNRLHEVEQRLARWLLMCQDRVDSPILPLTHDFPAQMLGAGRPTVTLACAKLEEAGLISNRRGAVRVLNRKQLEQAACECYGVIQNFNGGLGLR